MVPAHAMIVASFFGRWWHDPVATSTVFTALVAGGFALYRFRFVPSERRRETLDAMQKSYALSGPNRGLVLTGFPPFLVDSRDVLYASVATSRPTRSDLLDELEVWRDPTNTAAHEIVASEAKFRSLWALSTRSDGSKPRPSRTNRAARSWLQQEPSCRR